MEIPIVTCPLGDRHGIDLLNGIHTQLGTMSTQLSYVEHTSTKALEFSQLVDNRINDINLALHTLKQDMVSVKETQKNVRAELDGYRRGVLASAWACLLGLLGLIGMAIKDHFPIGFKP